MHNFFTRKKKTPAWPYMMNKRNTTHHDAALLARCWYICNRLYFMNSKLLPLARFPVVQYDIKQVVIVVPLFLGPGGQHIWQIYYPTFGAQGILIPGSRIFSLWQNSADFQEPASRLVPRARESVTAINVVQVHSKQRNSIRSRNETTAQNSTSIKNFLSRHLYKINLQF